MEAKDRYVGVGDADANANRFIYIRSHDHLNPIGDTHTKRNRNTDTYDNRNTIQYSGSCLGFAKRNHLARYGHLDPDADADTHHIANIHSFEPIGKTQKLSLDRDRIKSQPCLPRQTNPPNPV